jgi:hypothetical protein
VSHPGPARRRYPAPLTSSTNTADRSAVQLAAIVDIAIELVAVDRRADAVRFLTASGASFATTVRVLAEPRRRRSPLALNVLAEPRLKR